MPQEPEVFQAGLVELRMKAKINDGRYPVLIGLAHVAIRLARSKWSVMSNGEDTLQRLGCRPLGSRCAIRPATVGATRILQEFPPSKKPGTVNLVPSGS